MSQPLQHLKNVGSDDLNVGHFTTFNFLNSKCYSKKKKRFGLIITCSFTQLCILVSVISASTNKHQIRTKWDFCGYDRTARQGFMVFVLH